MKHPNETICCSIFGQIECVVARAMFEEGKVRIIDPRDVPLAESFNDEGQRAQFAIIIPRKHVYEFENRCNELYQ